MHKNKLSLFPLALVSGNIKTKLNKTKKMLAISSETPVAAKPKQKGSNMDPKHPLAKRFQKKQKFQDGNDWFRLLKKIGKRELWIVQDVSSGRTKCMTTDDILSTIKRNEDQTKLRDEELERSFHYSRCVTVATRGVRFMSRPISATKSTPFKRIGR